jgi:alanyl aminopeptidase
VAWLLCALSACAGPATPVVPTTVLGADPDAVPADVARIEGAIDDAPPAGRLPDDVAPLRYALSLRVVPSEERFAGQVRVEVELTRPRRVIWLHAQELAVRAAQVRTERGETVPLRVERAGEDGLVAARPARDLPAGRHTLEIAYDAAFDRTLKGLYRVDVRGDAYAFTQFEAISARLAFPCFDEPRFKTPFEVTVEARPDHAVIGNTPTVAEEPAEGGLRRVRFAPTERLPTYLLALAVGPLDVVEAPPIPPSEVRPAPVLLRGVAARGRGPELAYALARTPALLAELERYFGIPYPYGKLDVLAVPDFAAGAMENAGAITFREWLLLVDERTGPEEQRRAFAGVMAHELAHQWFGNLVTMPWWDDLWLNEAFATWMGNRCVERVFPEHRAELSQLASVHGAMAQDALVSARRIRQPIASSHDIRNAFDAITYSKGGGVLAMYERFLGEETFRAGIQRYLRAHAHGTATADDLLRALSEAAGRDVGASFRTFLEQPGVPLVEVAVVCDGGPRASGGAALQVRQSRYLPVGSAGDRAQRWQIPLCARYAAGGQIRTTCAVVTEPDQRVALEGGCPAWVIPNADGAGYFRFALAPADLARLRAVAPRVLTPREKMALVDSLQAAFASATLPAADVLEALAPLAQDPVRQVATAPMGLLAFAREQGVPPEERPRVEAYARRLYQPLYRRLGWEPPAPRGAAQAAEDGETRLLRKAVISFLATTGRDPGVRREAARRARAYLGDDPDRPVSADALPPSLVDVALAIAVEDGDAALFDHVERRLRASDDALVRGRMLGALASARDPALAARALALMLDPALRVNEVLTPLAGQMALPERREAAWAFVEANFDALRARIATTRAADLPWYATSACSEEMAARVEAFFAERVASLPGGPRNLAGALESLRLCAARKRAQGESLRRALSR